MALLAKHVNSTRDVNVMLASLRARMRVLIDAGGHVSEWRTLQYDAVSAYIESQRIFVALHSEILALLRGDKLLYARLQLESIQLSEVCAQLRALIPQIERAMRASEST